MPRATTKKQPTTDQVRAALIAGGRERGDEVMSVKGSQLLLCATADCDEDLRSDAEEAGEGFLEVTGNEVLEALGETNGTNTETGGDTESPPDASGGLAAGGDKSGAATTANEKRSGKPGNANRDGPARKSVAGGDKPASDKAG